MDILPDILAIFTIFLVGTVTGLAATVFLPRWAHWARKCFPPACFYKPSDDINELTVEDLLIMSRRLHKETKARVIGFSVFSNPNGSIPRIEVIL